MTVFADTELLHWLDDFLKTGCVEAGFEMDGGVYATFREPGKPDVVFRDNDNFRWILQRMANGERPR